MNTAPIGKALDEAHDGAIDGALEKSADHYVDDYLDELLGDVLRAEEAPVAAVAAQVETITKETPAAVVIEAAPEPTLAPTPVPALAIVPTPAVHTVVEPRTPEPPSSRTVFAPLAQATRWLRVAVDADSYAIELLRVQEVVRVAPIVRMRGALPAVLGVMNLRGRIVPVFDLGRWLGAGFVTTSERARIVVIERADELIGVLVSAVDDVVTLGRERIEPPMVGNTPGPMADAIVGIARVGATPTVLLDANALFG